MPKGTKLSTRRGGGKSPQKAGQRAPKGAMGKSSTRGLRGNKATGAGRGGKRRRGR